MPSAKLRDVKVQVRVSEAEKRRAETVAEKLGSSVSAAYRQAMNRLYDELFKDRAKPDGAKG